VFAALRDDAGERLVAIESKGDQLAGNLDTEYKRELLEILTKAYGNAAAGNAGELPIPSKSVDYKAAVILFSDINTKLPTLISG
jgi:type III restriction enzyme